MKNLYPTLGLDTDRSNLKPICLRPSHKKTWKLRGPRRLVASTDRNSDTMTHSRRTDTHWLLRLSGGDPQSYISLSFGRGTQGSCLTPPLPISRVNKQLRQEVLSIYYSETHFQIVKAMAEHEISGFLQHLETVTTNGFLKDTKQLTVHMSSKGYDNMRPETLTLNLILRANSSHRHSVSRPFHTYGIGNDNMDWTRLMGVWSALIPVLRPQAGAYDGPSIRLQECDLVMLQLAGHHENLVAYMLCTLGRYCPEMMKSFYVTIVVTGRGVDFNARSSRNNAN